jgi:hypothetical protein
LDGGDFSLNRWPTSNKFPSLLSIPPCEDFYTARLRHPVMAWFLLTVRAATRKWHCLSLWRKPLLARVSRYCDAICRSGKRVPLGHLGLEMLLAIVEG